MFRKEKTLLTRSAHLLLQPDELQDAHFLTEISAGLTTFATMAYIIAVNVSLDEWVSGCGR